MTDAAVGVLGAADLEGASIVLVTGMLIEDDTQFDALTGHIQAESGRKTLLVTTDETGVAIEALMFNRDEAQALVDHLTKEYALNED